MNNNVIESATAIGAETVNQEGGMSKAYTFRKLNSTDMFLMFKIIGKIGINEFTSCLEKDTVKQMISAVTGENKAENAVTMVGVSVMLEVANIIITNLPKCESDIYQMLSNTSNLTVNQVKNLDFATFIEMVVDFIKKDEFKDFILVVSRLFKSGN